MAGDVVIMSTATTLSEPTYAFRLSLFSKQASYRLTGRAIVWTDGKGRGEIAFADIRSMRIYQAPATRHVPTFRRCIITPKQGRACVLSSNDFAGIGFESRMKTYQPFIEDLFRRVIAANPNVAYVAGFSQAAWMAFAATFAALVALYLVILGVIVAVMLEGDTIAVGIFMLAVMAPVFFLMSVWMWRTISRNRPRFFDPKTEDPLPPLAA